MDKVDMDDVLHALEEVDWPVSARRVTAGGWGGCMGLTTSANQPTIGYLTATENGRRLTECFNSKLRKYLAKLGAFTWTSLQFNVNARSSPHRDYNNVGLSIILGLGQYTGGELIVEGEAHDIQGRLLVIDGSRIHHTGKFSGTRYSVVAFTHGVVDEAKESHMQHLALLGFVTGRGDIRPSPTDLDDIESQAFRIAITAGKPLPDGLGRGLHILHLFSGPANRSDGFAAALRDMGAECDDRDIVNGRQGDIADDEVWLEILANLHAGRYSGKLGGPPCDTFSNARKGGVSDSGPRPLRDATGPGRYGRKDLDQTEKARTRLGTLLACRDAEANKVCAERGIPWITEQPRRQMGGISMLHLDEFEELLRIPGVADFDIAQCHLGARTSKPTTLRAQGVRFEDAPQACQHDSVEWIFPSTGKSHFGPHPPLRGTEWAIPSRAWTSDMLRDRPPSGPYITKGAAAYPAGLNRYLAIKLCVAAQRAASKKARIETSRTELSDVAKEAMDRKIVWTAQLKKPEGTLADRRQAENLNAIGGLRNPTVSVKKLPSLCKLGSSLRALIELFMNKFPEAVDQCVGAVGSEQEGAGPSDAIVLALRKTMAKFLDAKHIEGVHTELYDTDIRKELLLAWATKAGDPDLEAVSWLDTGSPAGILEMPTGNGIFPTVETEDALATPTEIEDIGGPDEQEHWEFSNYASVENDPAAQEEVNRLISTNFVRTFTSREECQAWLGARPRLSKLAMITKKTVTGKVKRRLILDCKRGPDGDVQKGVNHKARQAQRVILPRPLDCVLDALKLLTSCKEEEDIEWLVLDFTDAFFQIPLRHRERQFYVTKFNGLWIVFLTVAQGSVNAPLAWGRLSALVTRLTQSLFRPDESRLQTYVDDPCATLRGCRSRRERSITIIVLVWRALGFKLAFRKGNRGDRVGWIGVTLTRTNEGVEASLKQEILEEVQTATTKFLNSNVVAIKDLRKYTGKCNHIAGIVAVWRPFLAELWAALTYQDREDSATHAPPGCVWRKQVDGALAWIDAFLKGLAGTLVVHYTLEGFCSTPGEVRITTDASPWGLGAFLVVRGTPVEWFATALTEEDVLAFGHAIGDPGGQQTWECLAVWLALWAWQDQWKHGRSLIEVRSDSVVALTLLLKVKAKGSGPASIARELALLLADKPFIPVAGAHTPGIANMVADALSRVHAPGGAELPGFLANARQISLPPRQSLFRARTAPGKAPTRAGKTSDGRKHFASVLMFRVVA